MSHSEVGPVAPVAPAGVAAGAPGVTTAHRAKLACVYVRQSSPGQVTRHGESTELQYQLVERAVRLGWPRDRVVTIDDDLGQSGASAAARPGFQRLLAELALARVGLVVSLDASRLARNNRDWYQLLEACSLFGALLADGERLYDPRLYHDRLLLGLSGLMSEAELYHLKQRLHAGERHKAERGELRLPLPAGLLRLPHGEVVLHPDEEVQSRLRLVFAKFRELGSAKAVTRYLRANALALPVRRLVGPAPQPVVWAPADGSRVLAVLTNPAYAGAYVYGRRAVEPARRQPGRPHTGTVPVPLERWPVLLHDRYPAYVAWAEYLTIRGQLHANLSRYRTGQPGAPRRGQALLQGIARCGLCGARMRLRYSGPRGEFPVYTCREAFEHDHGPRCQEVRALAVDAAVGALLLEALAPDRVALALATLEQVDAEDAALRHQWQLRLERARYEAERARRQYDACEPEHRLVARTLEGQWEAKLRALEQTEQAFQTWERRQRLVVAPADRAALLALAADVPALWRAPSTTPADRKRIARLLIADVLLDQRRAPGRVWLQVNWQTGATSEHWVTRAVWSYAHYAALPALQQRLRELGEAQRLDQEIADALNAEGWRTARGFPFTGKLVWLLRKKWGLPTVPVKAKAHRTEGNPARWADGTYSVSGAAAAVGVYSGTIYHWLYVGRLPARQLAKGLPWQIPLTEEQIAALRAHAIQTRPSRRKAP